MIHGRQRVAPRSGSLKVSVDGGNILGIKLAMTDARGDIGAGKNSAFTPFARAGARFRVADEVFGRYTVTVVCAADLPPPARRPQRSGLRGGYSILSLK